MPPVDCARILFVSPPVDCGRNTFFMFLLSIVGSNSGGVGPVSSDKSLTGEPILPARTEPISGHSRR